MCVGHTSIQYYNPTIHVYAKSEEVRHPCAFHVLKIILNVHNLYGSVGVECKNNDVRCKDVVPPLMRNELIWSTKYS